MSNLRGKNCRVRAKLIFKITFFSRKCNGPSFGKKFTPLKTPFWPFSRHFYLFSTTCFTAWLGNAFRPDETFCAGTSAGGIDSCQGDSGGPFFRKEGDDWIQYGLVSYGFGCAVAKQPGVYTQIKFYRTWVKNTSGVDVISNSGESDTTTQSSDGSTVAETTEDPCAGLEDLENTIDGINIVLGLFGIGDVPCSGRSQKFSVAILVFPSVALFGVFNYLF